jgi:hypothetical protein
MKAQKISLLAVLIMLASVLQGFSTVPDFNEKPVKMVVEFYPNYAGHLLGVAEIGYKSNYADDYHVTVKPTDLKYLTENKELLRWENGDEGPLTNVLISFPAYMNIDSREKLGEYLQDLNSAIALKSFKSFYNKYSDHIKNLDKWCGFSLNSYIFDYEEEIQRISQILMNNFDNFRYWVWPKESERMQMLAQTMNYQLSKIDIIKKWEELTGLSYQAPAYNIAISTGMANGPTGKSLGYDKQWCWYGENMNSLVQRVCEDAGSRILVDVCCNKYKQYNPLVCYQVYEALNKYLAEKILQDAGIKYRYNKKLTGESDLYAIFDSILMTNPEIKANDLYSVALDDYSDAFVISSL